MKKTLPYIFLCFLFYVQNEIEAQELLKNGSFEKYHELPDDHGQWDRCKDWISFEDTVWPLGEEADFFHLNGYQKLAAFEQPNSGLGYMGLVTAHEAFFSDTFDRQVLGTKFRKTLLVDKTYFFSLWISNGESRIWGLGQNGLGILLSTEEMSQASYLQFNRRPQMSIDTVVFSEEWIKLEFEYTVDSAYNYLYFANFLPDSAIEFKAFKDRNPEGCYYFVDDFSVKPGWLYIVGDTNICRDEKAMLVSENASGAKWVSMDAPHEVIQEGNDLTVWPQETTTYAVYDASDTAYFTVNVRDVPSLELGNDTVICTGEYMTLKVDMLYDSLWWNNGSEDPYLDVTDPGRYKVQVAFDDCLLQDSIFVETIHCGCRVSIPEAFTPNGDDLNDHFTPQFNCHLLQYRLSIYNKWGDVIFDANDQQMGWDGSYQGRVLASGTYTYQIQYTLHSGEEFSELGTFVLLR